MEKILKVLEKTALFYGIERKKILILCHDFGAFQRAYHKGSFLWQQGDSVSSAGIVLSGCVQAEKSAADGASVIVARHGVGALFGDILMSSEGAGSPVSLVAAADTQVLFLPFERMMREGASRERDALERFRLNLIAEMSGKYWQLNRKVSYLSVYGMRKRLAMWILDNVSPDGEVTLSLNREQLAAFLGVNRSALCRELSRMKEEGLLEPMKKSIQILNMEEICRLAE